VRFDNHSSSLHYFHYDLCQLGSGIPVYLLPVIPTLSVSIVISASVRFLVLLSFIHILHVNGTTSVLYARKVDQNGKLSAQKRRKSIPSAYHTPKNRPPGNSKSLTEALLPAVRTTMCRWRLGLYILILKLQFIHSVNGDESKTAKIIKKGDIIPTVTSSECQRVFSINICCFIVKIV